MCEIVYTLFLPKIKQSHCICILSKKKKSIIIFDNDRKLKKKYLFLRISFELSKRSICMDPKCLLDCISMSKAPVLILTTMIGLFCLWMYSLDSAGQYRPCRVPIGKNGIGCQDNRRHMPFQTSHLL